MVSSKLKEIRTKFDVLAVVDAPNMSVYPEDIQDALFEIFSTETFVAGIASTLLETNGISSLSIFERKSLQDSLFAEVNSRIRVESQGSIIQVDIRSHEDVLEYALMVEELRLALHRALLSCRSSDLA